MGVKCLAQEHNTVPRPGLDPGPFDPEFSALTIRPPRLPQPQIISGEKVKNLTFSNELILAGKLQLKRLQKKKPSTGLEPVPPRY